MDLVEIFKKLDPKNNKQFAVVAIVVVAGLAINGIFKTVQ